jgi:branched-chain amino acid aminotransferase
MQSSAERLMMAPVPTDLFVDAVTSVVQANQDAVPPYGGGQSFYLRPFLIGTEAKIGISASLEYYFTVFGSPVGPYYKSGLKPGNYLVSDYDRAAVRGTGTVKTGGNYAGSLYPSYLAKQKGYTDVIFLDPGTHKFIDESTGANFFGITKDGQFVTPKSNSILPSVTKNSLLKIAQDFGMNPIETNIPIESITDFVEAGCMGTAAVISPIGSITFGDKKVTFGNGTDTGPKTLQLYNELTGIQFGDIADRHHWTVDVPLN